MNPIQVENGNKIKLKLYLSESLVDTLETRFRSNADINTYIIYILLNSIDVEPNEFLNPSAPAWLSGLLSSLTQTQNRPVDF